MSTGSSIGGLWCRVEKWFARSKTIENKERAHINAVVVCLIRTKKKRFRKDELLDEMLFTSRSKSRILKDV